MRNIPALFVATALLLSGCASSQPVPEASAPAATSVTQAPEESFDSQDSNTQEMSDSTEVSQSEEAITTEDPSEPEQTSAPRPSSSPTKTSAPKPATTETPSPEPTKTVPNGYTSTQVASKNSRTACWVIVSGGVYDLTDWISKHPGGSSAIIGLCGTDATEAFEGKHGGEARPSSILDGYYLAPLIN